MLMQRLEPIPEFETGYAFFARLAGLYRPKERLTVSEWAARHIPHYDPDALPFLAEIMDALGDPQTVEVGDMGPAQGGKSMVGEAWMGWTIDNAADPFLMVQPDKAAAEAFVKLRINELIRAVPALSNALLPDSSADNMHLKLFRGMYVGAAWPVKSQLRQRPYCNVWADDFDAMPDDIEGEGGLLGLLEGRQTTFEGRETKLVSSSPAIEGGGIEVFANSGTDERLHPVCPSCGDRWEIDILRDLKFDRGTPDEAAETAHVVCGANGCVLEPADRMRLLRSCRDLPNRGFVAHNADISKHRRTFRRDGLMAFTSWPKLARQWREAEIAWDMRQDESLLRSFYNVKAGKNYRSRLSGEKPVEKKDLKQRLEKHWKLGEVPRGPKVLNIAVDAQHDRFEVAVIGTAAGRESWLIDRFPIHVLDDGLTGIQPFIHKEHWKVLLPLFDRKYPMVEDGVTVGYAPILSVAVDTGGSDKKGDQATEGAKFFFAAARALNIHASRITLLKGGSRPTGPLMPAGQFADQKVRGGAKRNSARLWLPNVHKIKNMIDARLRRKTPGEGYIHLPGNMTDEYLDELTAEELKNGKWENNRPRNETWDLMVYGEAAILKPPFAQSQPHMRWIPRGYGIRWPSKKDVSAMRADNASTAPAAGRGVSEEKKSTPSAKRRRKTPARGKQSWLGRLK